MSEILYDDNKQEIGRVAFRQVIIRAHPILQRLDDEGLPPGSSALVLVTDWSFEEGDACGGFACELRVEFSDVTNARRKDSMKPEHAQTIARFIRSLGEHIDSIVISCAGGMSRSPAIAAAIMLAQGQADMAIWENPNYSPNPLCYRLMLEAFGLPTDQVKSKIKTSKRAFETAFGRCTE
ncbi:MAG: hypothetical protein LBJ48_00155 [Coriobacteriales bacterium]|jgi:predicted protein tyrosine phosphatase|nr:hypothetical protein [Coriobacteriales bacterium]